MLTVRAMVLEGVKKHHIVAMLTYRSLFELLWLINVVIYQRFDPFCVFCVFSNHIQYFDFIIRGLQVVFRAFLNLEGHICIVLEITCKPDSGKVAPAEFLHNEVPLDHDLSDVYRVITADLVVLDALVLALVAVREQLIPLLVCHLHANSLCHRFIVLDWRFISNEEGSIIGSVFVLSLSLPLLLLFFVNIILLQLFIILFIVLLSHQYL